MKKRLSIISTQQLNKYSKINEESATLITTIQWSVGFVGAFHEVLLIVTRAHTFFHCIFSLLLFKEHPSHYHNIMSHCILNAAPPLEYTKAPSGPNFS